MKIRCMQNCMIGAGMWVLGGSVISAIIAYFMGVNIVIGMLTVVFAPGVITALVALGFVLVVGSLVALAWCYFRCR